GRIEARERPGAEMEMEPVGAFELARQRLMKLGRGEQARDFPLVLGGEQLVVGARDSSSQRLAAPCASFRGAHALDQLAVARRISRVAIIREVSRAPIDERV